MDDRHARHRRASGDPRRRPPDGFRTVDRARFRRLVDDALGGLPPGLLAYLDGAVVRVHDVPAEDGDTVRVARFDAAPAGLPAGGPRLADTLTVYRRPLEARARDRADLTALVLDVVVDVLAEHFGLDDDDLRHLGWDVEPE